MKRYIFSIALLCLSLVAYAQNSPVKISVTSCVRSGCDILLTTTITNKLNKTVNIRLPKRYVGSDEVLKTYAYGDGSEQFIADQVTLAGKSDFNVEVEAPNGVPLKAVIRLKKVPRELKKLNNVVYVIGIGDVPYYTSFTDVAITDGPNPKLYRNTNMVKLGETKPGTTIKVYESY